MLLLSPEPWMWAALPQKYSLPGATIELGRLQASVSPLHPFILSKRKTIGTAAVGQTEHGGGGSINKIDGALTRSSEAGMLVPGAVIRSVSQVLFPHPVSWGLAAIDIEKTVLPCQVAYGERPP